MSLRAIALAVALIAALPASAGASGSADVQLPPLSSHVMDLAHALAADDIIEIDARLESYREQTGYAIVAVIVGPLGSEPIEDFAYRAFNTWGIGAAKLDDGVLLVLAPSDRKVRIETGKGVGGPLTDLQSNDILKQVVEPPLVLGKVRDAVDGGTLAIEAALDKDLAANPERGAKLRPTGTNTRPVASGTLLLWLVGGAGVLVVLGLLSIKFPRLRGVFFVVFRILGYLMWILSFGRTGGGGGFGGGGGGYSGGGGRSGGGGSSDGY